MICRECQEPLQRFWGYSEGKCQNQNTKQAFNQISDSKPLLSNTKSNWTWTWVFRFSVIGFKRKLQRKFSKSVLLFVSRYFILRGLLRCQENLLTTSIFQARSSKLAEHSQESSNAMEISDGDIQIFFHSWLYEFIIFLFHNALQAGRGTQKSSPQLCSPGREERHQKRAKNEGNRKGNFYINRCCCLGLN